MSDTNQGFHSLGDLATLVAAWDVEGVCSVAGANRPLFQEISEVAAARTERKYQMAKAMHVLLRFCSDPCSTEDALAEQTLGESIS